MKRVLPLVTAVLACASNPGRPPAAEEQAPTDAAVVDAAAAVHPRDAAAATEPAPPEDAALPEDAPPAADTAITVDAGAPASGRVSLEAALVAKWTGTRETMGKDGSSVTFTGAFQANQFGGPQGHTISLPLPPGRDYLFEYRVRFEGDFPWTKGGKLPGLAGGNRPTGCVDVNGNGFSARMMWRGGGSLIGYTYDLDQASGCGNNLSTGFTFQAARWYAIKERVRINTGRNHDGVLQIWVDGAPVLDRKDMAFMNEAAANRIDVVLLHAFFGGSTQGWAPTKDCAITFADPFATRLE